MESIKKLTDTLQSLHADFEVLQHEKPILTRKDALAYFSLEEMVPTLIVRSEKTFYALMISGDRKKVDLDSIGRLLNGSKLEIASKEEVVEQLSISAGQVPLVGHRLPCIIDNRLFHHKYVYGGTGDLHFTLKISPHDLEKANNVILKFDE